MTKEEDVAKHYKRKQVESATPGQLIVMLYDAAIENLTKAEMALEDTKPESIEAYHNNLINAQDIITELMTSLDMDQGGDIAKNLYKLYDFMHYRLIDANMEKDAQAIAEVKELMAGLRTTWVKVAEEEPTAKVARETKVGLNIQG